MEWFERSIQAGIKDEVKIMAYNKDADLKTRRGFESHFGKFFDEDKEFTLSDFKDVLSEKFDEFIYNLYDELPMYEEGKEDAICEAVEDMLKY